MNVVIAEDACSIDLQNHTPGGCEHDCKVTPQGGRCLCPKGSSLRSDKKTCTGR